MKQLMVTCDLCGKPTKNEENLMLAYPNLILRKFDICDECFKERLPTERLKSIKY